MKSPYKVLYSNDTTNIEACISPFNPERTPRRIPGRADNGAIYMGGGRFTPAMLEATVDETADMGIDAHMLQPGMGWVPWWRSEVYPFAAHVAFMNQQFGFKPEQSGFAEYMAKGGDIVDVFVKRCRKKGIAPFISFRLNDTHGHEFVSRDPAQIHAPMAWHCFSPLHVQHPEWRLCPDIESRDGRVLNWALPEVRAVKFAFIKEIIEQYDIDGFELDFMRHCNFFRQEETTSAQRRKIMTDFISDVRAVLDRTARPGQRRWLCVRIPAFLASHDFLGIDVQAMAEAGADMFNLSHFYYAAQEGDYARIRSLIPDASVYLEMCHCTKQVHVNKYDGSIYRRTTPNQYYTTAHLARARGLDGVSTFNFVYYREHGTGERGPFNEPPFDIHRGCADAEFLARQPQHYFLSSFSVYPHMDKRQIPDNGRRFQPGEAANFELDMAPPARGWRRGGRLRIQSLESLSDGQWQACFNGLELKETPDRSEPYANPYPPLLGTPEQHRAWTVPADILKSGVNRIQIRLLSGGKPGTVVFLDVAVE